MVQTRMEPNTNFSFISRLTGNTLVIVFCAQHFKQSDGFGIWLDALSRPIRLIDDGGTAVGHGIDAGSLGNQIQYHLIVSARSRIVESGESAGSATTTELLSSGGASGGRRS